MVAYIPVSRTMCKSVLKRIATEKGGGIRERMRQGALSIRNNAGRDQKRSSARRLSSAFRVLKNSNL